MMIAILTYAAAFRVLALHPHICPVGIVSVGEDYGGLGHDGVVFECSEAFDGRGGGGPVGNNSSVSVSGHSTHTPSRTPLTPAL